jgi:hypothetical protein
MAEPGQKALYTLVVGAMIGACGFQVWVTLDEWLVACETLVSVDEPRGPRVTRLPALTLCRPLVSRRLLAGNGSEWDRLSSSADPGDALVVACLRNATFSAGPGKKGPTTEK